MGQEKTIELGRRQYWRPQMEQWIEDYICTCPDCQKNLATHHECYELLQPPEVAYCPEDVTSMQFIVNLSVSDGYPFTSVVVDCFTKISSCIPHMNGAKKVPDFIHIFVSGI